MIQLNLLLEEAISVIKRAGEAVLDLYDKEYGVEEKEDQSPVTEADLLSDRIITEGLRRFGYPILSEESEDDLVRLEADLVWIVDSLDGTRGFMEKTDQFSVMVGLAEKGRPVLGVVYLPMQKKLYYAHKGGGAFLMVGDSGPVRLQVSNVEDIHHATLILSRFHMKPEVLKLAEGLDVNKIIHCGSIGVKMGLIAEGQADLYFNPTDRMGQWDLCAPQIIVEEAGGQVSGMHGEKLEYNLENPKNPYGVMVSNGKFKTSLFDN